MIDPPRVLPVDHLSLSSIRTLMTCPERWRRRYLEAEYEPPSGKMVLGSAAGAAEAQHYARKMDDGLGLSVADVLDEFDGEWETRLQRDDVQFGRDKPGDLKDSGYAALRAYHESIACYVRPVSVERRFELRWEGVEWSVVGFMDLEEVIAVPVQGEGIDLPAIEAVGDTKMIGKRKSQKEADSDLQTGMYLLARQAEGRPASKFRFHCMVRARTPFAELVETTRTPEQLDVMIDRIFAAASEIDWRTRNDCWSGAAPGTWFCSTCSYACNLRM
jgi:hypothetical protein